MRIVPINHHDAATLVIEGSPAPADEVGSPVTNTQNSVRGEVWRNTDTDSITVDGSFADNLARPVNYFGMFRHRTHGASIRVQLYSGMNLGGSLLYDSGTVGTLSPWTADVSTYNWGGSLGYDPFLKQAPFWLWLPDTYAVKSYRITFSSFASLLPYWSSQDAWQVSRFVLGAYMEPITGPAFGAAFGLDSIHDSTRSVGGSLRTSQGETWRTMTLDLNAVRDSEARFWRDMVRYVGYSRDFVVSLYPGEGTVEDRDHMWLCKFVAIDALSRQARILTRRLQLQEV